MKVLDNLQHVNKLKKTITLLVAIIWKLRDKLENNMGNYKESQSRLDKAFNEIEMLNTIETDNKSLRKVISRKNEALERRDESIKHLRERLG